MQKKSVGNIDPIRKWKTFSMNFEKNICSFGEYFRKKFRQSKDKSFRTNHLFGKIWSDEVSGHNSRHHHHKQSSSSSWCHSLKFFDTLMRRCGWKRRFSWMELSMLIVFTLCTGVTVMGSDNDYWRYRSQSPPSSSSSSTTTSLKKLRHLPVTIPLAINHSSSIHHHNQQTLFHNNQQQQPEKPESQESTTIRRHSLTLGLPYMGTSHNAFSQMLSMPLNSLNKNQQKYLFQQQQQQKQNQHSMLSSNQIHHPHHQQSSQKPLAHQAQALSNQIPLRASGISSNSNNPAKALFNQATINDKNLVRMKGSKWWDVGRGHHPADLMSLEQVTFMDGRHTNAVIQPPQQQQQPPSSTSLVQFSMVPGGGGGTGNSATMLNTAINLPLRKKQRRLVRDNPGVLNAITKAMDMAIKECQSQFKDRRWNCPVNKWKKGKNVFGKIVQRGCRETAFVYALTSAAVTHSIARACSEGLIETCTCDYRNNRRPSGIDWEWGGCSDNIEFGYKFSRTFVDAAERGRDLRFIMNLHNNEVGRLHVSHEMRRECKCHGMSGSCTVKTCWMRLPPFREIGGTLKEKFDGASRVSISNDYRGFTKKKVKKIPLKPYEIGYKTPTKKDLIYYEESPDFCHADPKFGVIGTKGRICNESSIGVDGCNLLCCGRGSEPETIEEYERCNCTFHWCCQVNCKKCKNVRKIHRCL